MCLPTVRIPQSVERGQDVSKVSSVSIYVSFQQSLERDEKKREELREENHQDAIYSSSRVINSMRTDMRE